ncbi:hypothetical protein ACPV3O_02615 [Vibrio rotiferianus]|uniref:hypothetical protein n=1 Tax=Vibrio rotiferianus TaxID=190895 RepID=UPI00406A4567
MQRILDDLVDELRVHCKESNLDMGWLVKESQKRLMVYKELHMHRALIDEREIQDAFERLSEQEKQIVALGEDNLTAVIDSLNREI